MEAREAVNVLKGLGFKARLSRVWDAVYFTLPGAYYIGELPTSKTKISGAQKRGWLYDEAISWNLYFYLNKERAELDYATGFGHAIGELKEEIFIKPEQAEEFIKWAGFDLGSLEGVSVVGALL